MFARADGNSDGIFSLTQRGAAPIERHDVHSNLPCRAQHGTWDGVCYLGLCCWRCARVAGPTIAEDRDLLATTHNPILSELRRASRHNKLAVADTTLQQSRLDQLRRAYDDLKKKRCVRTVESRATQPSAAAHAQQWCGQTEWSDLSACWSVCVLTGHDRYTVILVFLAQISIAKLKEFLWNKLRTLI